MKLRTISLLFFTGLLPGVSMAQLSGNVGFVTDYIFRGVYQEESSASAGLDYEHDSGLYIGTWAADVGTGLETDLYFGYAGSSGDFGYSIGFTGYYYTDDWDDTYSEINLGVSYAGFGLDFASGEWDGFGTPADYTFTTLSYSFDNGVSLSYNVWGDQYDGDYFELSYGFDFMGLDLAFSLLTTSDPAATSTDPNAAINFAQGEDNANAEYAIYFGITKGISFGD